MVYSTEHEGHPDKHCVTWSKCCMTITAVFEQSEKLTSLLRLIEEEYGKEWAKLLVQSDSACTRCPMTAKQRQQQNRLHALTTESKSKVLYTTAQLNAKLDDWIGLDLFNDDTRPSGHISRPTQVNKSQNCFHSLNNYSSPIILSSLGAS